MEKLYWQGRKIKNNLIFHVKAFLHKRRDKLAVRKDDLSFERNVVKEVVKAFLRNVFIIAMILVVEQMIVSEHLSRFCPNIVRNIQSYIVHLNANIMEDSSILAGVLSAIIGIAGVFLGLYCANIMSMFAEKYANAPQRISRLFENDIITNKCIRAITSYLIFSIMVLFLLVLQVDIGVIMLVVSGLKGLEIIVSFGFMSRRTYQFSDLYYVTNAVYRDMYRVLQCLNKGKLFIKDRNFQNHYKKQAQNSMEILAEVNSYYLEKEEKISTSVENFMKNNIALLYSYWGEKSKIPYDSYWYEDKVVYKKWYKADDSEITTALQTGTLLGHDLEKNYLWLEESIEKVNDSSLCYLISKKSFASIIRWLSTLEGLSQRAVESGNIVYYVDYLYRIQKALQKTIIEEEFSLEEEMALAEHIVVSYLAVLIDIRKYIETQGEKVCACAVKYFERKNWTANNRYYNYADIKKLYDGIKAEIKLEGKRITPTWYINQFVAKHYYDELLHMHEKIDVAVNQYIPELAETLLKQKKNAGAMVVFAKYSEVRSKVEITELIIEEKLNWLQEYYKEKSIVWQDKPEINITKKFDKIYKEMSSEWCKCTSIFVIKHWEEYEKYPDILGACVTYLCELLVDAIVQNEYETFESNYKNLFGMLLLYQEYSRRELIQIKEKHRQGVVLAVYSNPIIEYSLISGYAYLWGEISGDSRWQELIIEDTKKNITKDDMGKKISEILSMVRRRMPAIHNRDILHTNWSQRIEKMLKCSGKISWKRDRFYEVYDGGSKLLKAVISAKNDFDFLNCESYEIFAIAVLNQFLQEDERYHSQDRWEDKYYE